MFKGNLYFDLLVTFYFELPHMYMDMNNYVYGCFLQYFGPKKSGKVENNITSNNFYWYIPLKVSI